MVGWIIPVQQAQFWVWLNICMLYAADWCPVPSLNSNYTHKWSSWTTHCWQRWHSLPTCRPYCQSDHEGRLVSCRKYTTSDLSSRHLQTMCGSNLQSFPGTWLHDVFTNDTVVSDNYSLEGKWVTCFIWHLWPRQCTVHRTKTEFEVLDTKTYTQGLSFVKASTAVVGVVEVERCVLHLHFRNVGEIKPLTVSQLYWFLIWQTQGCTSAHELLLDAPL